MAVFRHSPSWAEIAEVWSDDPGQRPSATAIDLLIQRDQRLEAYLQLMLSSIDAWPTWTPALTQGVAVTTTVNRAVVLKLGRMAICRFSVTAGSAGTAGSAITLSTPYSHAYTTEIIELGDAYAIDAAGGALGANGQADLSIATSSGGTNTVAFLYSPRDYANYVGADPAWTLANGDKIGGTFIMETTS